MSEKKDFWKSSWFWLIVVLVIGAKLAPNETSGTTKPAAAQPVSQISTQAPAPAPAPPIIPLPAIETQFIQIVSTAQQGIIGADNNMKKGGIKSVRDKSICKLLTHLNLKDWVGTVEEIDSNSDGKGVLSVSIAQDITIKTWNNDISDFEHHTLINPESALFKSASNLKVGQRVKFSGQVFRDSENCISEGSISLDGKISSPEYIMKFSAISAL